MTTEPFFTDAPAEVVAALGGRPPTVEQWKAISHPLEPCALIAGAGSGKTAVMAARIVWLVVAGHARAGEILGLTFTNKAAENLTERVRRAIAPLGLPDGDEPGVFTYHGFAARLISDWGLRGGIEPGAALLTDAQAWQLCSELLTSRTYEALEVRSTYHASWVRMLADECANHLVEPEEVAAHDRDFLDRFAGVAARALDCARKRIELSEVVRDYARTKGVQHRLDYGDQIRFGHRLAQDPRVIEEFRARWRVVLLDEYQDTNVAQARMLRALIPDGYPVMAVGDPDQNIYAWRGASLHNLLAFAGQFPPDGGAASAVLPLRRNFRSGRRILALANALIEGIPAARRPPDKELVAHPPLGEGEVAVVLAPDQVSEAERIAEECSRARAAGVSWAEMAVLCRKKRLFGPVVEALRARDIPVEVIGLGGLLRVPEVLELVSLLRVLDDPMRNAALARLLMGPRWRIGYRDLALVARHAAGKNRALRAELPGEPESPGDVAFSLAEALSSLDEVDGVSAEARRRLADAGSLLAGLRQLGHVPLPEMVARALDALGLARELDASPSPAALAARRNLANFLDRIAAFSPLDGDATLGALLAWLDAVEDSDEEIEATQPSDCDAVKVMTIHQAKGLEFDLVLVPGLASGKRSSIFPDTRRQANPVRAPQHLPFALRGDNAVLPRFEGNLAAFERDLKERALEEERRLLYVACTRAKRRLVCSAAHWYQASGWGEDLRTPMGPSEFWHEVRSFPEVDVIEESAAGADNPLLSTRLRRAGEWPRRARREPDPLFPEGLAAAVAAARAPAEPDGCEPPPPRTRAEPAPPRGLSVSELVTHARCPKRFYWTAVRPLPVRRSAAARIGTAVHAWIEARSRRQPTLIDLEEFEEHGPAGLDSARTGELKEVFTRSRFESLSPVKVEAPFTIVAGEFVVRGRIDAVYERLAPEPRPEPGPPVGGTGWEIVDFKTGAPPPDPGPEWLQLDLYALAAQEVWGKSSEDLTLTFAYLGGSGSGARALEERSGPARPGDEIRAGLESRLASIRGGEFDPLPGPWCRHCDFLRFCEAGRALAGA